MGLVTMLLPTMQMRPEKLMGWGCLPVKLLAGAVWALGLGPKGLRAFLVLPTARTAKILT